MRKHRTMLPMFCDYSILDADFDAADGDAELCVHIAQHGCSLHADAWGDHDPLSLQPWRFRRHSDPQRHYHKVDHKTAAEPQQQYQRPPDANLGIACWEPAFWGEPQYPCALSVRRA